MISKVISSLSWSSTAQQKYRLASLHSKKLHILGFLARMVCTRSLEIFFLSLSERGTYHFCNLSFPCRLNNSMNCICGREKKKKESHRLPN
ncbi:hypothetical protein CRUP_001330 [Coryphaenoides rupestris]|nr:hypothetical protein CRUP_001330 [Coryphaenoides rupestris]